MKSKVEKCEHREPEISILKKEKCPKTMSEFEAASLEVKKKCPSPKEEFPSLPKLGEHKSIKDEFEKEKKKLF